jgi:SET domain
MISPGKNSRNAACGGGETPTSMWLSLSLLLLILVDCWRVRTTSGFIQPHAAVFRVRRHHPKQQQEQQQLQTRRHGGFAFVLAPLQSTTTRATSTCSSDDNGDATAAVGSPLRIVREDDGDDDDVDDDLTKEEITSRFNDVLAHYRQSSSQELPLETVQRNLLCTRLPDLRLNRCRVAPSSIPNAGNGVFARRNIRRGELITLFPADAVLLWNEVVGDLRAGYTVLFGPHIPIDERNVTRVTSYDARLYELQIGPSRSIVADHHVVVASAQRWRHDETTTTTTGACAAYLGHIINDGACLLDGPPDSSSSQSARSADYARTSYQRHNAAIIDVVDGCHYMVVATKDIGVDDEIFVSYGEGYWRSRCSNSSTIEQQPTVPRETTTGGDSGSSGKTTNKKKPKSTTTTKNKTTSKGFAR